MELLGLWDVQEVPLPCRANPCLRLSLANQGWVDLDWTLSPQGQSCGPQLCHLFPPDWWEAEGGQGGI